MVDSDFYEAVLNGVFFAAEAGVVGILEGDSGTSTCDY